MNYSFSVKKDLIETNSDINLYSGNVNTYIFNFNMGNEWNEYIKFGIFIKNGRAYNVKIEESQLKVPQEVLLTPGDVSFGLFGTNGDENIKRISTNLITFRVSQGAYKNSDAPKACEPDFWETILTKCVPQIINGNWYIYDMNIEEYVDTGVALGGGVDYSYVDQSIQKAILDSWEVGV